MQKPKKRKATAAAAASIDDPMDCDPMDCDDNDAKEGGDSEPFSKKAKTSKTPNDLLHSLCEVNSGLLPELNGLVHSYLTHQKPTSQIRQILWAPEFCHSTECDRNHQHVPSPTRRRCLVLSPTDDMLFVCESALHSGTFVVSSQPPYTEAKKHAFQEELDCSPVILDPCGKHHVLLRRNFQPDNTHCDYVQFDLRTMTTTERKSFRMIWLPLRVIQMAAHCITSKSLAVSVCGVLDHLETTVCPNTF
jgi:hypothetical protein